MEIQRNNHLLYLRGYSVLLNDKNTELSSCLLKIVHSSAILSTPLKIFFLSFGYIFSSYYITNLNANSTTIFFGLRCFFRANHNSLSYTRMTSAFCISSLSLFHHSESRTSLFIGSYHCSTYISSISFCKTIDKRLALAYNIFEQIFKCF